MLKPRIFQITMCAAEKKRRGCFFYGCITSIILGLILFVGIPLALYFGFNYAVKTVVNNYADEQPMELPVVEMPQAEVNSLRQRVDQFQQAISDNTPTSPLELSADELNALIFHDPQLAKLKGKAFLDFVDNKVKGQLSIPLSDLNIGSGESLYLNGTGIFEVSIQNGTLSAKLDSLEIKGKPLPAKFSGWFQGKNLFENAQMDPEAQKFINRISRLEIKDDKLILEKDALPPQAEVEDSGAFQQLESGATP